MKKYNFFKIGFIILCLTVNIGILVAQNSNNNITFILTKYENGKIFKTLTNGEQYTEFKISGYENQAAIDSLTKHIARSRGVNSFIISNNVIDHSRTGKLTCYKYADNLQYYKYLFSFNNVKHLIIDGKEVMTDNLPDLDK
jgi:hypothetical protein